MVHLTALIPIHRTVGVLCDVGRTRPLGLWPLFCNGALPKGDIFRLVGTRVRRMEKPVLAVTRRKLSVPK